MNPAEYTFWRMMMARAALKQSRMASAILTGLDALRAAVAGEQLEDAVISGGAVDSLNAAIRAGALAPVTRELESQVRDVVADFGKELPLPAADMLGIRFNALNPRMVATVRALKLKVVAKLTDDAVGTVQKVIAQGMRDSRAPLEIARSLRDSIGLTPPQEKEVRDFRDALEGKNGRDHLDTARRDKQFDRLIKKGTLTPAQIHEQVKMFRAERIGVSADAIAGTASLDAQRAAQHLAWESAVERGAIPRADIEKVRIGVVDARERKSHRDSAGEIVGFDEPFSTGEVVPGERVFGCRCVATYRVRRASASAA